MKTETDTLALNYLDALLEEMGEDYAQGTIFGKNEDTGEELTAYDWLEDVLDIQYIVSSEREYLGARLLLTYGGPNAWLDTKTGALSVYWGSDTATKYVRDSFTDALDEALAELWEMGN
jgi:hypothetical protein